jgi:hypothetical protein
MSHPWRRFDYTENSMQAGERRSESLHPAQVGDISTLRIRVTLQLGAYTVSPKY